MVSDEDVCAEPEVCQIQPTLWPPSIALKSINSYKREHDKRLIVLPECVREFLDNKPRICKYMHDPCNMDVLPCGASLENECRRVLGHTQTIT